MRCFLKEYPVTSGEIHALLHDLKIIQTAVQNVFDMNYLVIKQSQNIRMTDFLNESSDYLSKDQTTVYVCDKIMSSQQYTRIWIKAKRLQFFCLTITQCSTTS